MKLKFKAKAVNEAHSKIALTEADVNRGYRMKAIEKLSAEAGDAITAAHYKYKPVSGSGFYIMPDFGYLSKLTIAGTGDEDPIFNVKLNDVHAQDLKVNGKVLSKVSYEELIELVDDIGLAMVSSLISPASFANPSESLSEDLLLEYGPISWAKGIWNKAKDALDKRAANKAEEAGVKAILEGIKDTITEALEQSITKLLQGKQYVKVVSEITNDTLKLELKADFVTAMVFNADPRDARKIVVSKLLTPLGEVRVLGKSIPDVLDMVGKVLGINFKNASVVADAPVDNPDDSDETPEDDLTDSRDDVDDSADSDAGDSWEDMIGSDAFSELRTTGEAMQSLTEAYKLKIPAANYDKAMKKVTGDGAISLVKYFLLNELDGVLSEDEAKKLDTKICGEILDIVEAAGTFNPNGALELMYILVAAKKHDKITNISIAFAKEMDSSYKKAFTLENDQSIIYSRTFFNSANDVATLRALARAWYGNPAFSAKTLEALTPEKRQELIDAFDISDKLLTLTAGKQMRKLIFVDPTTSGRSQAFRKIDVINAIAGVISGKAPANDAASSETDDKPDAAEDREDAAVTPDAVFDACLADVENLEEDTFKELLKLATKNGLESADMKTKIAKALLTAFGKLN